MYVCWKSTDLPGTERQYTFFELKNGKKQVCFIKRLLRLPYRKGFEYFLSN